MFSYLKSVFFGLDDENTNSPHEPRITKDDFKLPSEHVQIDIQEKKKFMQTGKVNYKRNMSLQHNHQYQDVIINQGSCADQDQIETSRKQFQKFKVAEQHKRGGNQRPPVVPPSWINKGKGSEHQNSSRNIKQPQLSLQQFNSSSKGVYYHMAGSSDIHQSSIDVGALNDKVSSEELTVQQMAITSLQNEEQTIQEFQALRRQANHIRTNPLANELPTVPQSAYLSLLSSSAAIAYQPPLILSPKTPALSMQRKAADVLSEREGSTIKHRIDKDDDDEDSEERKETEQLPITSDFMNQHLKQLREAMLLRTQNHNLNHFHMSGPNAHNAEEECVDVEMSDNERYAAHKSIRRSVVAGAGKQKLNWSCQFSSGSLSSIVAVDEKSQERSLFNASNGASSLIQNSKKKQYHISRNPRLLDLSLPNRDLKFITVNMLSTYLQQIDISNNKLETLPEELCLLTNLQKLKLDHNQLKQLPPKIKLLSKRLEYISFAHNNICEIPKGFEELNKLEVLILNDNRITDLPSKIGQMNRLKKLHIQNNSISRVPISCYRLEQLQEFSSEWFIYLNPPMPKVMKDSKGQIVIDQFKQFCRYGAMDICNNIDQEYRTFSEFILHFHQVGPQDINKVVFGQKKRNLIHQFCINNHVHLLNQVLSDQQTTMLSQFIDLNAKDSEGTTPITFAFRANYQDLLDLLLQETNNALNLDIMCPKYGSPLHMCILKHKFGLALNILERVDAHILNPNGSNSMHILFANYQTDTEMAERLALQLIKKNVNINLVDKNGLTPLHVAVKRSQQAALQFALNCNNSQFIPTFNFNAQGKKLFTPLHYSILKNNHDAFLFMISPDCLPFVNVFALDDMCRTPRSLAIINSPFYKLLILIEKQALINDIQLQKTKRFEYEIMPAQVVHVNINRRKLVKRKCMKLQSQDFIPQHKRILMSMPQQPFSPSNTMQQRSRKSMTNSGSHTFGGTGKQQPRSVSNFLLPQKLTTHNIKSNNNQNQKQVHHHQPKVLLDQSVIAEENTEKKVINNIFISNLQINLNLNINISIPPSPKSTRNNQSHIITESFQSSDNNKKMGQKKGSVVGEKQIYKHTQDGREDLSVIDDEAEVQLSNNISKSQFEQTQRVDMKGIINQIMEPQMVKNLILNSQSNNNRYSSDTLKQEPEQNNLFINFCSVNGPSQNNLLSDNNNNQPSFLQPDQRGNDDQPHCPESSMIRNQSCILQEEPIHQITINENVSSKLLAKNQIGKDGLKQKESSLIGMAQYKSQQFSETPFQSGSGYFLSSGKQITQRIQFESELSLNPYLDEYRIIVNQNESMGNRFKALYRALAKASTNVLVNDLHLITMTMRENEADQKVKEVVEMFGQAIKSNMLNEERKQSEVMIASQLLNVMQSLTVTSQQGYEELDKAKKFLTGQLSTTNSKSSLLLSHELFNLSYSSNKPQQLDHSSAKFPMISTKLDHYLKTQRKHTFSNIGSPRTLVASSQDFSPAKPPIRNTPPPPTAHYQKKQMFSKTSTFSDQRFVEQPNITVKSDQQAHKNREGLTKFSSGMLSHYKPQSKVLSQVVKNSKLPKKQRGDQTPLMMNAGETTERVMVSQVQMVGKQSVKKSANVRMSQS